MSVSQLKSGIQGPPTITGSGWPKKSVQNTSIPLDMIDTKINVISGPGAIHRIVSV